MDPRSSNPYCSRFNCIFIIKELPPESVSCRKTVQFCSVNMGQVWVSWYSSETRCLGRSSGGQIYKHNKIRVSPFTVQVWSFGKWTQAVRTLSWQSSLYLADYGQHLRLRTFPPTQIRQLLLGTCPHNVHLKTREQFERKVGGGIMKVGTVVAMYLSQVHRRFRKLSQFQKSKTSHQELPLDLPIHYSRPRWGFSPFPW